MTFERNERDSLTAELGQTEEQPQDKIIIVSLSHFVELTGAILKACQDKTPFQDKQALLDSLEKFCTEMTIIDPGALEESAGSPVDSNQVRVGTLATFA
jgi:hypothetical protein